MILTEEQKAILRAYSRLEKAILVKAFAGASKTTSLVKLAENNPQDRFLYLAYNRKIVEEAKGRFPSNVTVKTAHSLAYGAMGMNRFRHKLSQTRRFDYSAHISGASEIGELISSLSPGQYIQIVREMISQFERTADQKLNLNWVRRRYGSILQAMILLSSMPLERLVRLKERMIQGLKEMGGETPDESVEALLGLCARIGIDRRTTLFTSLGSADPLILECLGRLTANEESSSTLEAVYARLGNDATRLWEGMLDPQSSVPMDHSTYLKMYQLSRPSLSGYTTIMVDEFQDANPVILDIVDQQSVRKVYVGDPHQSIYGFTGAVNTIESMESSGIPSYPLTRSFRFGPHIARYADRVLALKYRFHGEKHPPGSIPKIIGSIQHSWSQANGTTILCRTNAGVVEEALALITKGITDMHIGESISSAFLSDLKDIHWLAELQHKLIKNSFIREFKTVKSFHAECKLTGNVDYLRGITMIRKLNGSSIPRIIDQLLDLSSASQGSASHSIITAHKAKGCEWDRVRISSDFEDKFFGDDGKVLEEIPIEEINLLYVAVTRAKHVLVFPPKFQQVLGTDDSSELKWSPAMTLTSEATSEKTEAW